LFSGGVTASAAVLSADRFSVTLTTSALTSDTEYTLTINNVQDNAGNAITAGTQVKFFAWVKILNSLAGSLWDNINGTDVALLTADPRYPNSPSSTFAVTNGLEIGLRNGNAGWNSSYGDNFGLRVTGTITAPGTAQYHFFLRSDDASQFFLNTSGPAIPATTGTPLVREDGCCNAFYEPGLDQSSTTTPVSLTGGQQYGFVVLLKEGGGGDGVAVGMRAVGDTTPAGNLPSIGDYGPKVVVSAAPTMSIAKVGSTWQITYTGTLEWADTVTGTFQDVPSASSPYTVTTTGASKFFRARN
jgi:hypothetical protein